MDESRDPGEWKIWKSALGNVLLFVGLVAFLYLVSRAISPTAPIDREVPYSELEQALATGRVDHVVVSDESVAAYLKSPDSTGARILNAERVEPEVAEQFSRYQVPFSREHSSNAFQLLLSWIAPVLFFVAAWCWKKRVLARLSLRNSKMHCELFPACPRPVSMSRVVGPRDT